MVCSRMNLTYYLYFHYVPLMEEHRLTNLEKSVTVKYLNFTLDSNSVVIEVTTREM
jgi:hypothetical protein